MVLSSKTNKETRFIEFRSVDNNDGKMVIEGYAIIYDKPATQMLGFSIFTEVIKHGTLDIPVLCSIATNTHI